MWFFSSSAFILLLDCLAWYFCRFGILSGNASVSALSTPSSLIPWSKPHGSCDRTSDSTFLLFFSYSALHLSIFDWLSLHMKMYIKITWDFIFLERWLGDLVLFEMKPQKPWKPRINFKARDDSKTDFISHRAILLSTDPHRRIQ